MFGLFLFDSIGYGKKLRFGFPPADAELQMIILLYEDYIGNVVVSVINQSLTSIEFY